MVKFEIQVFLDKVREAVVNESLGVERLNYFYIHESLTEGYLLLVLGATEAALREKLELPLPCAKTTEEAAVN